MSNEYFKLTSVSEKPEKEGWYETNYGMMLGTAKRHYSEEAGWDWEGASERSHYLRPVSLPVQGLTESIEVVMRESEGYWKPCSGCHESEDGHDVGEYPYSEIFKCKLGSGCHECGGVGAIWDEYRCGDSTPTPTVTTQEEGKSLTINKTYL